MPTLFSKTAGSCGKRAMGSRSGRGYSFRSFRFSLRLKTVDTDRRLPMDGTTMTLREVEALRDAQSRHDMAAVFVRLC